MSTVTVGMRCPACGAALRQDAPWCTLCYADLRPAPAPDLEPPRTPPVRPRPLADPLGGVAEPSWPCAGCGAANPLAAQACTGCGAGFLAGLREQEGPLLELPVVGDITRLGRGQRFALAGGVVLAAVLLTLLLGLLLS